MTIITYKCRIQKGINILTKKKYNDIQIDLLGTSCIILKQLIQ